MQTSRKNSLDPITIQEWRWAPFLNKTVQAFLHLKPQPYPVNISFLDKKGTFGSKAKPQVVLTSTWACRTKKLRYLNNYYKISIKKKSEHIP